MKTLYINISGESLQSSDELLVIGKPEDAIINKFYFEVGKEILKGVNSPGVTSIKKKDIVTDFKNHDEAAFGKILERWECIKSILLGENPTGTYKMELPSEYVGWLQNNSQSVYAEIAKSLYQRGRTIEISIDKIYRNAIGIIINNIDSNDCKQFVVNDNAVTDDSAIALAIMEKVAGAVFLPYEDYVKDICPKCGKNPCECPPENPVCPKCGKNPCECNKEGRLFPIFGITLGETKITEIQKKRKKLELSSGNTCFCTNGLSFIHTDTYDCISHVLMGTGSNFPEEWKNYFGFSEDVAYDEVKRVLNANPKFRIIKKYEYNEVLSTRYNDHDQFYRTIVFIAESKYLLEFVFYGDEYPDGDSDFDLQYVYIEIIRCPDCHSKKIRFDYDSADYGGFDFRRPFACDHKCKCGNIWSMDELEEDWEELDDRDKIKI